MGSASTEHHAIIDMPGRDCRRDMNAPAVLELPLDDSLLKVLSSDSRREILRLLRERRMTGAELAARLELGKPAVSEHLKKLQEADLIERFDDPERRWVYYSLSARGRGILEPQRVRFYLVMSVAAVALMVGVVLGLGLFVLLQGDGLDAQDAAAGDALAAGSHDGTLVRPGSAGLAPVDGAGAPVAPVPASDSAPAPASDPQPGTTEETEPAAETSPEPAAAPEPEASAQGGAPSLHARPSDAPRKAILAFQARDVDAANRTVRLHSLTLDAAALQQANLTEAVKNAAEIPGVGILVRVPETLELPTEVAATLSLPELDAAFTALANEVAAQPPAEPEPATQEPGMADATPPADAAASDPPAGTLDAAPGPGSGSAATEPATAPAPASAAPAVGEGDASVGSGAAGTAMDAGPVVRVPPATASASPRAAIPLVALIGAAVMVSIYLPTRRSA
jgi:DNA-binding transcriptional ArsR family regulator